jgi:hypothetical protein
MEGNPLVRNANKNYYRLWKFKNLMGITNAKAKSVANATTAAATTPRSSCL